MRIFTKRFCLYNLVALGCALIAASDAYAQQRGPGMWGNRGMDGRMGGMRSGPELSIGIGPVWPVGGGDNGNSINDESNTGIMYGAALSVPVSSQVSVRLRYECSTFRREDATNTNGIGSSTPGETKLTTGTGDFVVDLFPVRSFISPYIFTGVGIVQWKRDTVTVGANRAGLEDSYGRETAFAWNGGAGFKLMFNRWASAFAEASYYLTFTRDDRTAVVPLRAGVALGRMF